MSEYAERDIIAQGEYYTRHVSAMTDEDLHSKSAIAAELAHRDIEIERLQDELREVMELVEAVGIWESTTWKDDISIAEDKLREAYRNLRGGGE